MLPYNLEVRKGDFKIVNENGKDNSISIELEILSENLTFKKAN
jgi:hypothetical protein